MDPEILTEEDILMTDRFLEAFPDDYFKTDVVVYPSPVYWRNRPHFPPEPGRHLLLTGHSDYGIQKQHVITYHPQYWWTVNNQTEDLPNVFSLPLGITNDCEDSPIHRIYGNRPLLLEVREEAIEVVNLVYCNFSIFTFPLERQYVYDKFHQKPWVTVGSQNPTMEGRKRFLQQIKQHDFVLCPRGNGLDTHRLWETLYMRRIPIVKRDKAFTGFEKLFPICFIDDWEQVTPEFLSKEKERLRSQSFSDEPLKVRYWIDKISSLTGVTPSQKIIFFL